MRHPSSSVCLGSVRTAVKLRSHEEFWCRDPEQNQDQTSDGRSSALLMVVKFLSWSRKSRTSGHGPDPRAERAAGPQIYSFVD